jgi:RNA polymerase sigma-70 factor (ECF subfamily)
MVENFSENLDEPTRRREFEKIAYEHMNSLYSTALRMTRNELDAEDLVQDVYVRAWRFFHKFKRETNFKAWIFKILTNTFINQYRKKTGEPFHVEIDKVGHQFSNDPQDVHISFIEQFDSGAYKNLFGDEILEALDAMSDEFKLVVLLADIQSFSYKEIAQIMDCPVGTVMSRLSRGRRQLQIMLSDYAKKKGIATKRG